MRDWIKLLEDELEADDDEGLRQHHREEKMELNAHHFCEQLGFTFSLLRPVNYDESTGEMYIFPDNPEVTFEQLRAITKLGKDVKVQTDSSRSDHLVISLTIV